MRWEKRIVVMGMLGWSGNAALGQFATTGNDIKPENVTAGQMPTGAHDDNSGAEITNVQVYGYYFGNNPDDPYFDQDPGINASSGSGLQGGSTISFNILSSLTYWDGTGPVTQMGVPAGESLQYNLAVSNRYVTSSSGAQSGFNIGAVASNQTIHRHLNAFLLASDGNADPSDGVVATPGIYFVTIEVVDNGYATSQPLQMIYDNGLPTTVQDQARLYIRNVFAPLTNIPNLSIAATTNPPAAAVNFPSTWNVNANGTWSDAGAWSGNVPETATDDAVFGQTINGPRTITLSGAETVGHLAFDNANAYTLTGSALTIGDGSAPGDVVVNSGSHAIAAPLYLASATTFAVAQAGSTLTVSSAIESAAGVLAAKEGGGTLVMPGIAAAGLNVVEGTVRLSAGGSTSVLGNLAIQTGATLDLTNNTIVVNYSGSSPGTKLISDIASSYDGGRWDMPGLTSSAAAGNSYTGIGISDNGSSVLIRYTYNGDVNLDGKVDGDDYALIDRQVALHGLGSAAIWTSGDFNYDGVVNAGDYLLMDGAYGHQTGSLPAGFLAEREAEFGPQYVADLTAMVPEPGMAGILLPIAAALTETGVLSGRRRRRVQTLRRRK